MELVTVSSLIEGTDCFFCANMVGMRAYIFGCSDGISGDCSLRFSVDAI